MSYKITFRIICECGASGRAEVDEARVPPGIDPKAAALREAWKLGWRYRRGRIGKSVITVECPKCRPKALNLEADLTPEEAIPATFAEDIA